MPMKQLLREIIVRCHPKCLTSTELVQDWSDTGEEHKARGPPEKMGDAGVRYIKGH